MKKILFGSFFWLLQSSAVAQFCHSQVSPNVIEILRQETSLETRNVFPDNFNVRLFVHVLRRSDGTGGRSRQEAMQAIHNLDDVFNIHNICFTLVGFEFIDDDDLFPRNFNTPFDPTDFEALMNVNAHANAIDIYIAPLDGGGTVGGKAMGFVFHNEFNLPYTNDGVVVGGRINNQDVALGNNLAHEIAHVLGLFHPFMVEICNEFVNHQNCEFCGDLVCDTPASPGLGFSTDLVADDINCVYIGTREDINGAAYSPDTRNIMDYTLPNCLDHFTPGQGFRMRNFLATRQELIDLLMPEDISIADNTIHTSGSENFYKVFGEITNANVLTFENGSIGQLIGGDNVVLKNGFSALSGSNLVVSLDDENCNSLDNITLERRYQPIIDYDFINAIEQMSQTKSLTEKELYSGQITSSEHIQFHIPENNEESLLMVVDLSGRVL